MPDPTPPTVQLSDTITICLRGALTKLRTARALAEQQGEPVHRRALISTAWAAVQDALDVREPTP